MDSQLSEKLNEQLNFELESAYVYFAMASYMDAQSLDGFANWMKVQAQEEVEHAMRFYNYLQDRGAKVTMLALPQPKGEFGSVLDAFETALEHEKLLAKKLDELAGVALEAKDNTTYTFLEWFLTEQVEEVASVGTICDKVRLIGDSGMGLLMLSNELGTRKPGEEGA